MNSKRNLQRRRFLQTMGLGAGFLPLLSSSRAPAQAANGYPTRLITITWTNGIVPDSFYPDAEGPIGTLPEILAPLQPYADKVLAMRRSKDRRSPFDMKVMMDAGQEYNGHQSYPAILTGSWQSGSKSRGASIDQMIADNLSSQGVVAPLLNLGARNYGSSTSYRSDGQRNTPQTDPSRLFGDLFSGVPASAGELPPVPTGGSAGGVSTADVLNQRRGSVLDFVGGELEQFGTRLGTEDRSKIQAHLEAVRELEARLEALNSGQGQATTMVTGDGVPVGAGCEQPNVSGVDTRNINDYPNHVSSILAIAGAAVKCDAARCITVDLIDDGGGNSLTFPWLGIGSPDYHAVAHAGRNSYDQKIQIDTWFMERVAELVGDLASTPEGDGSVLDNTCVLVTNDMNEGSNHFIGNVPYLIIGSCGGFFKTGETIGFPDNVANNQLLTTLCHAMGMDTGQVGDDYSGDIDSLLRA